MNASSNILIKFENVKKSFNDVNVLSGVTFGVLRGEITSIVGKSGAGKSVILKHIIGLLEPDEGDIKLNGVSLLDMKKKRKKRSEKKI